MLRRSRSEITRDAVVEERAGWGGAMRGKALGWALTKKQQAGDWLANDPTL